MFFLLRMAFWLGLVLVLLPTDKTTEDPKLPQVNAAEAITAAGAAVADMTQFCTRQPSACEVGKDAAAVIGHRAQAGARKLYNIITEKKSDTTGSIDSGVAMQPQATAANTLTSDDLDIEWKSPPVSAEPAQP